MKKNMEKIQIEENRIRKKNQRDKQQRFFSAAVIIISLISISYTLFNRQVIETLKYSLYVSIPVAIFLLIFIIINRNNVGIKEISLRTFSIAISILLISVSVLGIAYYSYGVLIKDMYLWVKSPSISKTGAIVLAISVTLFIAAVLFFIRLRYRAVYGLTEVIVGLGVSANRVSFEYEESTFNTNFYLAILTAAVYLVVRGLDNIHQGFTKEPIDPVVSKLFKDMI